MSDIPSKESQTVEFKHFSGGISVKELSSTMCAFANSEGGSIFIGVTDNGRLSGVILTTENLDHIQNSAREGCTPPVQILLEEHSISKEISILEVKVEKSTHLHSTAKGYTLIRVGSQDKKIRGDELLRLAETKSQISFEDNLLPLGIDAVDLGEIEKYALARKTVSNLSPEELLIKLGFAKNIDGLFNITVGGFLLFGKKNHSGLIQRDFQFIVYETESMYVFREELSLAASEIPDRLMELLTPYIKITTGVSGMKRDENYSYPEAAIREVILNAIAHRDYRISGLKNELRVYPDRIEVISAGQLPPIISLENIQERHYSRNPRLTHALMTYGLVEELGQGITLMKEALCKNDNPPPKFIENRDQFKVIFYKKKRTMQISLSDNLLQHFDGKKLITRKKLEVLTGLSSTSVKNGITTLLKQKRIERIGRGPATKYRKL